MSMTQLQKLELNKRVDKILHAPSNLPARGQQLEMAFTTEYIGMANNARYSDAEMDDLFNQTRTETDTEARAALFNQILTKAQEEAIYASLCNPLTLYAYSADLQCPEFELEGNYFVYDFTW